MYVCNALLGRPFIVLVLPCLSSMCVRYVHHIHNLWTESALTSTTHPPYTHTYTSNNSILSAVQSVTQRQKEITQGLPVLQQQVNEGVPDETKKRIEHLEKSIKKDQKELDVIKETTDKLEVFLLCLLYAIRTGIISDVWYIYV